MDFFRMVFHNLNDSSHIKIFCIFEQWSLFFSLQAILVTQNCTIFYLSIPFLKQICTQEGHKILAEILIAVDADETTAFL